MDQDLVVVHGLMYFGEIGEHHTWWTDLRGEVSQKTVIRNTPWKVQMEMYPWDTIDYRFQKLDYILSTP